MAARHPWLGEGHGDRKAAPVDGMDWLARFHAGERAVTEEVYRGFVETVDRGVSAILQGADRETVVHEVFLRLMADVDLRRAFHGGDLGAWLLVIARNHAIDYARPQSRDALGIGRADSPVRSRRAGLSGGGAPPVGSVLDGVASAEMARRFRGAIRSQSQPDGGGGRAGHAPDDPHVPRAANPAAVTGFLAGGRAGSAGCNAD